MESEKIFTRLKTILEEYESQLLVIHNKSDHYYLNTQKKDNKNKEEFFGAVQIKKLYVSFHLMPIYYFPELIDSISSNLKNRMQGKSCFNFKEFDQELFLELEELTKSCLDKYKTLYKI